MNSFKFNFGDDDEGFELVDAETTAEVDADEDEKTSQANDDEVIWETEED